jgi:hypothetical protein
MPFIRATTEDHALDSFQNFLFSIARFHEYTGRYPEKITVVGYEMKRRRFTDLHRAALRWPLDKFDYIGVDPEGEEGILAQQGEVCIPTMVTINFPSQLNESLCFSVRDRMAMFRTLLTPTDVMPSSCQNVDNAIPLRDSIRTIPLLRSSKSCLTGAREP